MILLYGKSLVLYHLWHTCLCALLLVALVLILIPHMPLKIQIARVGTQVFYSSRKSICYRPLLFHPKSPRFHGLSMLKISHRRSIQLSIMIVIMNMNSKDLFIPSMMVVASKWSQSLKNLVICSILCGIRWPFRHHNAISKCLILLTDLYKIQIFHLIGWRIENMDNDVRCLVKSWPKLRTLKMLPFNETFISLSTLRIIA